MIGNELPIAKVDGYFFNNFLQFFLTKKIRIVPRIFSNKLAAILNENTHQNRQFLLPFFSLILKFFFLKKIFSIPIGKCHCWQSFHQLLFFANISLYLAPKANDIVRAIVELAAVIIFGQYCSCLGGCWFVHRFYYHLNNVGISNRTRSDLFAMFGLDHRDLFCFV